MIQEPILSMATSKRFELAIQAEELQNSLTNNQRQVSNTFIERFGQDILKRPWGISVTEDNVFVTDSLLHALLQFSKKDCKLVRSTGTKGSGEGQLDYPCNLCSDYNGDVYVAEPRSNFVFFETAPFH